MNSYCGISIIDQDNSDFFVGYLRFWVFEVIQQVLYGFKIMVKCLLTPIYAINHKIYT
jgi:hypothetical protein